MQLRGEKDAISAPASRTVALLIDLIHQRCNHLGKQVIGQDFQLTQPRPLSRIGDVGMLPIRIASTPVLMLNPQHLSLQRLVAGMKWDIRIAKLAKDLAAREMNNGPVLQHELGLFAQRVAEPQYRKSGPIRGFSPTFTTDENGRIANNIFMLPAPRVEHIM